MQFTGRKRRSPPAVIIIALIDVLIVVLIFLIVTTTFKEAIPALRITLPETRQTNRVGSSASKPFIITITTNEPYFYVGKTDVTLDELKSKLIDEVATNPNVTVAIRADTEASLGRYVKVLDLAHAAKIENKNIITYSKESIQP